ARASDRRVFPRREAWRRFAPEEGAALFPTRRPGANRFRGEPPAGENAPPSHDRGFQPWRPAFARRNGLGRARSPADQERNGRAPVGEAATTTTCVGAPPPPPRAPRSKSHKAADFRRAETSSASNLKCRPKGI